MTAIGSRARSALQLVGAAGVCLGAFVALRSGPRWSKESRLLDETLHDVLGRQRIEVRADLTAIRRFLRESVNVPSTPGKRPAFRESAAVTLASGEGFCGERSRPPSFVAAVSESPDLLTAIGGTVVLVAGLGALARGSRCAG